MNKVLIIDDAVSIRKIYSLYLRAEGFEVRALAGADSVVEVARTERPDVILMDLDLPGIDGFAATTALKTNRDTAGISVIIISATSDEERRRQALEKCCADDYLTKPFDPDELVAKVKDLCRRKEERARRRDPIEHLMRCVNEGAGDTGKPLRDREAGTPSAAASGAGNDDIPLRSAADNSITAQQNSEPFCPPDPQTRPQSRKR